MGFFELIFGGHIEIAKAYLRNQKVKKTYPPFENEIKIKTMGNKPKLSELSANNIKQELEDLYMQGYYDRDWKLSENDCEERGEIYAKAIIKKYGLEPDLKPKP